MKIQRKILIISFLFTFIIAAAIILIGRDIATNLIKQQVTNNLINTTQSRTEHIKTFLDLEREAVKQGSESVIIKELLLAEKEEEDYLLKYNKVIRRLKYTTQTGEYTYDIFVLDTKGIIIASSDEEDIGKDKSNDPYFLEGKEGVFIKDAYISFHKQKKTIAFSAPVLNEENDRFLGVLVFKVSLERLFQITTDRTGLGETGEVYLVNKDGYMITPSRFIDEVFLKQKIDLRHIHTEEASPTEPSDTPPEEGIDIIRDYRGIEVLSVHIRLPEMDWFLIAQIDAKEAFASVTKLTQILLLMLVITLFISIFFSSFVSRTITGPLRKLHEGTEEITKGNLDYKVGTPSSDEVGQLSRAFDEMTANLKKSREELEEYSRNLEKKVEERTRDLEIDISKRKKTEKALYKSQQEFASLFKSSPEALVYLDKKGTILDANLRFCELFGYTLKEIKGRNIDDGMIHPSDKIEEGKKLSIKGLEGYLNYETIRKKKDGTLFPVSISATPLVIDGQHNGEIGIYIDISERIKMQNALQESEKRLSYALKATNDGIWDWNLESGKLYLSDHYYEMLGYNPGEITITQKGFEELLHKEDKERVLQKIQECIEGKTKDYSAEFRLRTKSGKWNWILGRGNVLSRDSTGKALRFLGTHVDISRRKETEEKMKKLARIDSLTGCDNRGYGLELLDRQLKLSHRSKSPLLLAFLDIDRFKSINDNFGHDEGDRVLKEVTGLFKSTLREIDIICRMGGDEFLLIFPNSSLKEASLIKERLNKNLTKLNQTLKKPYKIELSIGLSEYNPDNPQSADELIRVADEKMYKEKKKKK
jgi:diguanylate cyclase (GGDEF)-like protein/PAS domain S-box-containing protein